MATREELLEQAAALEDEAVARHGDDPEAGELRRRAAKLRVEALGPKPYPVQICAVCFHLTGWVGADGACSSDLRLRREHADPNRLGAPDLRMHAPPDPVPLLRRVKRSLGVGGAHDRAREWLTKVDPGETGPVEPEEGWALEWPVRFEQPAPEGPDLLVAFDMQSLRFEFGSWRPADVSPGGRPRRLVPREFAASLPIEALAEAWNDFEEEVAEHNRRVWQAESARREGKEQAERERRAAEAAQRGTSELLG